MFKYASIMCFFAVSNLVNANILPVTVARRLLSASGSVAQRHDGFKLSQQEVLDALYQEKNKFIAERLECTEHINNLNLALQAAEKERNNIEDLLSWVHEAITRLESEPQSSSSKSVYEGKNLKELQHDENAIINQILSIKEVITDFSSPAPNGSFWNPLRRSEAIAQHEIKLGELYRKLEYIRACQKNLQDKE